MTWSFTFYDMGAALLPSTPCLSCGVTNAIFVTEFFLTNGVSVNLRLFRLSACMLYYSNTVRWAWLDWGLSGWLTTLLQCFDTVGWVIHQTCKNRRPYNLYCVGADVKPCSINQLISQWICLACDDSYRWMLRPATIAGKVSRRVSLWGIYSVHLQFYQYYCRWIFILTKTIQHGVRFGERLY